jgi:hypothetical protein
MPFTVPTSFGGAAFAILGSAQIQMEEDSAATWETKESILTSALYGDFDEIPIDLIIKYGGTPRYYDTNILSTMFPYIGGIAPGTRFGGGNVVCNINSINGDQLILKNAIIGKMPDLILGIEKAILGPMEIWGIVQSGDDPTNAATYWTYNASGGSYTYAAPTTPGTALIGQQEYTGVYGSVTGMTSFQAQETWSITHQYTLEPIIIQGRTRAFRLGKGGYRCLARCMPSDATMAAILTALELQGSNAVQGTRLTRRIRRWRIPIPTPLKYVRSHVVKAIAVCRK